MENHLASSLHSLQPNAFQNIQHSILDNLSENFLLVDSSLSIIYFNEAARENCKKYLSIDISVGFEILKLVPEERVPALKQLYAQVFEGLSHLTEVQFSLPGGIIEYFENSFVPMMDADKKVIAVIIKSTNITERKKIERSILEAGERWRFALDAADLGAWDWNLLTNEVVYSASYKKLFGYSEDELVNHIDEWQNRVHPDDRQRMQASVQAHLTAGLDYYESTYRIRIKDGTYRWILAKGKLVAYDSLGKPTRMIGTHADLTDTINKQNELKKINERFDIMMMATNELLWDWDILNDHIYRAKEGLKKVYGISNDDNIVRLRDWLKRIHPDDHEKVHSVLNNLLGAANHQTFELEYRFRKDDGRYSFIYDRGILLKDENDRPVRMIGSAQDISERKRLEEELIKNELESQRLINEITIESQELERGEIGKELHDNINQVLTTTKLYLDLALSDKNMSDELIEKSRNNISTIINEIRQLSRSLMDPTIGDLGIIDSITDLVENLHLTKKIKIDFSGEVHIENLLTRNQKLTIYRIIQESLNNVLRHAMAQLVIIKIFIEDDKLKMIIKDDGIGFDTLNLKKGAGLKNIQNRVYLINGYLQIISHANDGCTISIQFPIKKNN